VLGPGYSLKRRKIRVGTPIGKRLADASVRANQTRPLDAAVAHIHQ